MPNSKKPGLDQIAPPPRRASGNLSAPAEGPKVQFNVRIDPDCATYAKVLAAKSGRQLNDLVEEAIALLKDKHGEV